MTAQHHVATPTKQQSDAGRIPQLYAVLEVIEQLAPADEPTVQIPDERDLCQAYERSSGIAKHGFGATAEETITAATIGARALIGKGEESAAAAQHLSRHLRSQIVQLSRFVGI